MLHYRVEDILYQHLIYQRLGLFTRIPHKYGLIEVPVETSVVDGDVNVADISVLQRTHVGDPVTDHLVNRGAAALRKLLKNRRV